jgi:hypothetical protein
MKTLLIGLLTSIGFGLVSINPLLPHPVIAQSNENFLVNPGFENDWTNWTSFGNDDSIDTTNAKSGSKSLKFVGNMDNLNNKVASVSYINVMEGQPIRIRLYSKDTLTAGTTTVGIRFWDESGVTMSYDFIPLQSSSNWINQEQTIIAPKNTSKLNPIKYTMRATLYIQVQESAVGSVWIDDVSMSTDNFLNDPSFELNNSSWSGNLTYNTTAANVRTGTSSAQIAGNSNSFNEFHSTAFTPIDENQYITLMANVKSTLAYNETLKIGFGFYNSSQTLLSYAWSDRVINRSSWSLNEFTAQSPAGTQYVKVFFNLSQNATGTAWIDDVVLHSQNVLMNPGFEDGYASWIQRATALDTSVKHRGTQAVKFTGDSANAWNVMEYQNMQSVTPGDNFMLKSYVKSNLTDGTFKMGLRFIKEDRTTTLSYAWYTVPLSTNWTENNEVFVVPDGTYFVQPYFNLSQDAIGNVWVDDTLLSHVLDSLKFTLPEKHVWSTDSKFMTKFETSLTKGNLADYKVRLERYAFGGSLPVTTKEYLTLTSSFADYFDVSSLPLGYSIYKAHLIKKSDSSVLQTVVQEVLKADKYTYPTLPDTNTVAIDGNKAFTLNGTTFIPRYMYHVDPYDYASFKERGFNAVQAEGSNLDMLQYVGLKGMVRLYHSNQVDIPHIQEQVTKYKDHPAVFAWLLNDEPDINNVSAASIVDAYNAIKAIDTNHPVYLNTAFKRTLVSGTYLSGLDVTSHDPYPFGGSGKVTDVSDTVDDQVATNKPVATVLQAFGNYGTWKIPTAEQERAMTYLAVNHGTKAIGSYANDDYSAGFFLKRDASQIWAQYKILNQELEALKDVIAAAPVSQNITSSSPALDIKVREYNGTRYLFAVNTSRDNITTTFSGTGLTGKTSAEVTFESRTKTVSSGSFNDTFSPYMVHIYKILP